MQYVPIGRSARMPYGHALISVLIGGVEQQIYSTLDGSRCFVVARPGPYQLKVDIPTAGMVELLAFDGEMPYPDALALFTHGDPGEILSGIGPFTVDQMVGIGTRTPLVFGEGTGSFCCKLFNQRQWGYSGDTLDMVAFALSHDGEYIRGPEIGQLIINYGPVLPA